MNEEKEPEWLSRLKLRPFNDDFIISHFLYVRRDEILIEIQSSTQKEIKNLNIQIDFINDEIEKISKRYI